MHSPSRFLRAAVLAAGLTAAACRTQAAFELFLKFYPDAGAKPIVGESTDTTYPGSDGWFRLEDFEFGIQSVVTLGGAGTGTGKASASVFSLSKRVDSTSTGIFKILTTGAHFKSARLVLKRTGGNVGATPPPLVQYEFNTVFVSSQNWSGAAGDESVTEKVSLVVGQALISYVRQNSDGSYDKPSTAGWNFIANTSVFDPLPDGP